MKATGALVAFQMPPVISATTIPAAQRPRNYAPAVAEDDAAETRPGPSDPGTSDPGTSDPGTSQPGTRDPETSRTEPARAELTPASASAQMPPWVPRAIVYFFIGWAALFTLYWLVRQLRTLLIMLLVSLFLSFALEPAVNRLERWGIRRGVGTGLVFLGVVAAIGAFGFAIGSVLADQISGFVDEAPTYIQDIESWIEDTFDVEIDTEALVAEFQAGGVATRFATNLAGNLVSLGTQVLNFLFQLLTIALFTFYLVTDGPRLRRAVCSLLEPDRQRQVLQVWDIAIEKTGGYIYSRGILALMSAAVHWAAFEIIGTPFPLPLALWVGLISQFVPVIGTYIAGALPVIIGLIDEPSTGLWMLVVIVIYQQVENYVLAPPITAHTMDVHVAVAFGSVIAGGLLLGVVGALLALPAAATIQAFASTLVQHHEVVATSEEITPRRRWRRRRT